MSKAERIEADALGSEVTALLPEVAAVYLFGSAASEETRGSSDVDLAVLPPHPIPPKRLAEAVLTLSERLRRDVDLVDLSRASTVMRAQVVSTGRVIHDSDPALRDRFEMLAYSAYARLNEERRGILERITTEGRVHGR